MLAFAAPPGPASSERAIGMVIGASVRTDSLCALACLRAHVTCARFSGMDEQQITDSPCSMENGNIDTMSYDRTNLCLAV